eukprot:7389629-Prymnesium_polylepis.1
MHARCVHSVTLQCVHLAVCPSQLVTGNHGVLMLHLLRLLIELIIGLEFAALCHRRRCGQLGLLDAPVAHLAPDGGGEPLQQYRQALQPQPRPSPPPPLPVLPRRARAQPTA